MRRVLAIFLLLCAFPRLQAMDCLDRVANPVLGAPVPANLPHSWPLATAVVGRINWSTGGRQTLSAVFAAPDPVHGGKLVDLNAFGFHDPLPTRFLMGDGSAKRVLVGVDTTPGSPLHRTVDRIVNQMRWFQGCSDETPETVIQLLKNNVASNMGYVRDLHVNGVALPWDQRIPTVPAIAVDHKDLTDDHEPIALPGVTLPVVPLEEYATRVEGYCLQQCLLASLVLRRFGIAHRIVNGATPFFIPPYQLMLYPGHTWIELADGRVLDISAGVLDITVRPTNGTRPIGYPMLIADNHWYYVPGYREKWEGQLLDSWRFDYRRYYILRLDR